MNELYSSPLHVEGLLSRYLELYVMMSFLECSVFEWSPRSSLLKKWRMWVEHPIGCCFLLYLLIGFMWSVLFRKIVLWCYLFFITEYWFYFPWLSLFIWSSHSSLVLFFFLTLFFTILFIVLSYFLGFLGNICKGCFWFLIINII